MDLFITSSRNLKVLFQNLILRQVKPFYLLIQNYYQGKLKKINSSEVKLITLKNSSSSEFVKKHYPNAILVEGKDGEACKEMLLSGEADAYISDIEICDYFPNDPKFKKYDYTVLEEIEINDHEYIAIAVSPNDNLFYNFIKKQIDKNGEGWIEKSWAEYYDY